MFNATVKLKMLQIVFASWVLVSVLGFAGFHQNTYDLIYERAEVISYNRDYITKAWIKNFKYNRTQATSNGSYTLIRDVTSDLKMQIEAYKFASNKYRDFPVLFSYSYCEGVLRDDFGMKAMLTCGNMSANTICPVLKKGTYFLCHFKPNAERYPPNIPEGSYMLDTKFFHGPTEIAFLQSYGTVKNKAWW